MTSKKTFAAPVRLFALLVLVAGWLAMPAQAQETNGQEYKVAYNEALELAKAGQQAMKASDTDGAIDKFAEAYTQFVKAADLAAAAEDDKIAQKSRYVAAQLAYKAGLLASKAEQYDAAIAHFSKGLEFYDKYPKNQLGKAIALKKKGDDEAAIVAFAAAIEAGTANNDYDTANKARSAIRDHFVFLASKELSENPTSASADQALQYLEQMQEHVKADADTYFYMATAYNVKSQYDQAVEWADKALETHKGSRTDKAKIFFIKGEALMNKGAKAEAREAFKNASFGDYKASSEHYLEQLKGNS